jgi:hypothetical protein
VTHTTVVGIPHHHLQLSLGKDATVILQRAVLARYTLRNKDLARSPGNALRIAILDEDAVSLAPRKEGGTVLREDTARAETAVARVRTRPVFQRKIVLQLPMVPVTVTTGIEQARHASLNRLDKILECGVISLLVNGA